MFRIFNIKSTIQSFFITSKLFLSRKIQFKNTHAFEIFNKKININFFTYHKVIYYNKIFLYRVRILKTLMYI